jgi:hypothetical protein
MNFIQHCFICRHSDSTVDAEIEPRTVATLALTVRRSNHSATSHLLKSFIISFLSLTFNCSNEERTKNIGQGYYFCVWQMQIFCTTMIKQIIFA